MSSWFCPACKTLIPTKHKLVHQDRHRHPKGKWSKHRNRTAQTKFRERLIQRDGLRCALCGRTDRSLDAHHDTPTDGRLLCSGPDGCHKKVDRYAR